jgi:DNA-binding SARP family transcriptional activator/tetratricopeptide (TPR) repeat protein
MADELHFGLLGPLLVRRGDAVIPIAAGSQRVLLAALLLSQPRAMPAEKLAELLWPSGPPPSARVTVQNYVRRLRGALGDTGHAVIATGADGYLLRVPADALDISRFEAMTAQARRVLRDGRPEQAAGELRLALSLWRGHPLADVPCEQLAGQYGARLEELRLRALEDRIEADLYCGQAADVLGELRTLIAAEPLRERLYLLLMRALYLAGRQSDALLAFHQARRVLADEMGVDPGTELRQLHQQILDQDPALAVAMAAPVRTPPAAGYPRQLPAGPAHFTGRAAELDRLNAMMPPPGAPAGAMPTAVITGPAGVGKTTLAIQWAYRAAEQFPDGQLYLSLRGFSPDAAPLPPAEGLGVFLEGLQPAGPIPAGLSARANLFRTVAAGKRLLIILDNARDADQVRPLLPGSAGSMVVITSRNRLAGLAVTDSAQLITLDLLAAPQAKALITARLAPGRAAAESAAVTEIAELCGRLPLALAVAAARAAVRPGRSLAELAAELRDPRDRLDVLDAGESAASARSVFSWSYASLPGPAAAMFRRLGLHPGPDAGAGAAASLAGVPPAAGRRALEELARASVVTETAAGRYAQHDLLRAYARERAGIDETAEQQHAALHRMVDYYLQAAHAMSAQLYPARAAISLPAAQPGVVPEDLGSYQLAWAWAEAEYAVLPGMVAVAADGGFPRQAWQLAWALETFLSRRGRWDELGDMQRLALQAAHQAGDVTGQAHARCGLGLTSVLQGRYERGRAHLEEAARLFREAGDGPGEARAHIRVGTAYWRQGRQAEAHESAQRALELFRASGDRAGQAGALNNIGLLRVHMGDPEGGLESCQRGLGIFTELGYRRGEANALDSLGEAYLRLGRTAEAVSCLQQSLSVLRELGDQYNQAEILTHLAAARQAEGDIPAAGSCLQQALAILTELRHPDAARVRAKLRELGPGPALSRALG